VVTEQRANGGEIWAIEMRDGGELLGAIGTRVLYECRTDFGYSLARDAWGHGFATEAATAVVQVALEIPSIWRVQAMCDVEHSRSARVLEKVGLQYEGTLRRYCILPNRSDTPRDMLCFARIRE
jgi:RimJ/RimL family protein N-acetyltransferase